MTKWAVCGVVCGAMCVVFGGLFLYGAIADPLGDMFAVELILGLLGLGGGVCGIAGGFSIQNNKEAARKLLLTAAVILLPYALVFFLLFMVARNRTTGEEEVWKEGEEI